MKVLVADDERIERLMVQKRLTRIIDKEDIILASNGKEVVNQYHLYHPEVLVLDIEMPGMSGLEAAQEIRKEDNKCAIIFLTAFDDFDYAKKAISVHAYEYLLKPVDEGELLASVESAIHAVSDEEKPAKLKNKKTLEPSLQQDMIRSFIDENYMYDLSIEDLASRLGYSDVYFSKLFKEYFGISFIKYLTDLRLEHAKDLLVKSDKSIQEVGNEVGYPNANYFTKLFRRTFNMTPKEYRLNQQ